MFGYSHFKVERATAPFSTVQEAGHRFWSWPEQIQQHLCLEQPLCAMRLLREAGA